MDLKETVSKKLNEKLQETGMTLDAFAAMLGVSRSSLQGYLKGTANIRSDTLEIMAENLNISVYELMGVTDTQTAHASCFRTLFAEAQKMNAVYAAVAKESLELAEAVFNLADIT